VVVIIGIVTAVTLPSFVRSMRGNRLRAASRTLVAAGRYARSMAVMQQASMALVLDLDKSTVSVRPAVQGDFPDDDSDVAGVAAPAPAAATVPVGREPETTDSPPEGTAAPVDSGPAPGASMVRTLDRVQIVNVVLGDEATAHDRGSCVILYRTNGTCVPYEAKLAGPDGDRVTVAVDAVSSAKVEAEE
jgi:type II secretory pathway pseudopilin PulG